ncbi:MAG: CRISPR-associated protein Cas4 [Phycisphaeraceae bacterium]|nr:CRISPR-associated protein Cas4 [Phycisphaeraceae bacterium]
MAATNNLLPISALQHLIFCKRQCALIHIEGLWAENRLTVEGRILHKKAHGEDVGPRGGGRAQSRPGVRIVRGLWLESQALGLVGKADVVEFHDAQAAADPSSPPDRPSPSATPPAAGPAVPGAPARAAPGGFGSARAHSAAFHGVPLPIEYKRGRPKKHDADKVQLCAQALCLEEMLGVSVPAGALFYGETRRRDQITFDETLRQRTAAIAAELHEMVASGVTPRARREKKCDRCSMLHLCLPEGTGPGKSARKYLEAGLRLEAG